MYLLLQISFHQILTHQFCLTIAHDTNVLKLYLDKLNYSSTIPFLSTIFQQNHSIRELTFNEVSFVGKSEYVRTSFSNNFLFSTTNFYFVRCNLTTKEFRDFILSLSNYLSSIKTFSFQQCLMGLENYSSLFEFLYSSSNTS
jgi:hypothetical protein